jgi:hypothetical protein
LLIDLFSLCGSCWECGLFVEFGLEEAPLDVMVLLILVANHPFVFLFQSLKWKLDRLAH